MPGFRYSWIFILVSLASTPLYARITCWQLAKLVAKGQVRAIKGLVPSRVRLSDLNTQLTFSDLRALLREVLEKFNPETHYLVGLGRSPFPVTSYFNLIRPQSAQTVPLSYKEYVPFYKRLFPHAQKKLDLEPYSAGKRLAYRARKDGVHISYEREDIEIPGFRENLFRHLDRYFPLNEIGNRKIVLVDFADYGTSLVKFYADVEAWKKLRGVTNPVEILFLQQRPNDPGSYWGDGKWEKHLFSEQGVENVTFSTIDLARKHGTLRYLFDWEVLKTFAPYPHYVIPEVGSEEAPELKLNPAFETFERALQNDFNAPLNNDPLFRAEVEGFRHPR